jgi:hypothetical protein
MTTKPVPDLSEALGDPFESGQAPVEAFTRLFEKMASAGLHASVINRWLMNILS